MASGVVTGVGAADTPPMLRDVAPAAALEKVVRDALGRSPCVVSFSGGMDSSLILAVADRLALREGLPRPIPVTFRFRDAPAADEADAQEAVIRAVGCSEWERIEIGDEADLVGPIATRVLREHGLLHPANAFLHLPVLERAAGGTVLTGWGGDQVLGGWRQPRRKRRPWWWPGRGPIGGRPAPTLSWLRPSYAHRVRRAIAQERAAQPHRFDDRVVWHASRRDVALGQRSLEAIAAGVGARVASPLIDPRFVHALAAAGGSRGFAPAGLRGRPDVVAAVFGDLPADVVAPRPKALFREVFWRAGVRDLMRGWDGGGVDERLVDPDRLRAEWRSSDPPGLTALLAQQVWLHRHDLSHRRKLGRDVS